MLHVRGTTGGTGATCAGGGTAGDLAAAGDGGDHIVEEVAVRLRLQLLLIMLLLLLMMRCLRRYKGTNF
jgi:hypothetical protein